MRNRIYIKKAAKNWEEGLPIGNGRMGASILGKIAEEMITINEETIWYGPFRNRKNPECRENIDNIRQLLINGELNKAQFMAKMAMTSTPKYMNPYQPAGDLKIQFPGHLAKRTDERSCYLDMDEATAYVKYRLHSRRKNADGSEGELEKVRYVREHFVSQKYNVVVIRLTADEPGRITVSANMNRKPFEEYSEKIDTKTVCNYGQCGTGGVHYFTGVRMAAKGGEVKTMGDFVYVENADEVLIYVTSETDFEQRIKKLSNNNLQVAADMEQNQAGCIEPFSKEAVEGCRERVVRRLDEAEKAGYEVIRKAHLEWFQPLFNRVKLDINHCETDERLIEVQLDELKNEERESNDYLTVLLFNYAKYLMICSSYDCRLPANLQGIWNGEYVPPWQSEFTININTEMNYWFVEKCNLPECHMPLFDLIDRLVENGKVTARELYGCRGFCAHHNTSLWANTDPEGIMDASPFWPMGGAWLSLHMYEHYLFTGDETFLKERALPVMREAIRFFEDYLYEMKDGTLVTGPSVSPENTYLSSLGEKGALCMGPTMDIQILRQLFSWYLEGSRLTSGDKETEQLVEAMLSKLPLTKISSDGRVMEWLEEYEETEPGHRHISHMYGLHPGNEITEDKPELFAAAEKTIDARLARGGGHTGWSRAWIACFFARLKNGEKVFENVNGLLKKSIKNNLYDTHPPFQIDGNFGIAEAIMESLVQSHNTYIELLPALPVQWHCGSLKGVRLRGALTADLSWENGKVTGFDVTADKDMSIDVKYENERKKIELIAGEKVCIY